MTWIDDFILVLTLDMPNAEVGLWCDKCLLPSAMKVPLVGMMDSEVARFGVIELCVDCDEEGGEVHVDVDGG